MTTKACQKCFASKPLDEFLGKLRKHAWCKPCYYSWRRSYLKTPKGKLNSARKNTKPYMKFSRLKHEARKRGLEVTITKEQYIALITGVCGYCSFPVEQFGHGIDRMDNAKGYVPGNVIACCGVCNQAKSNYFSYDEMSLIGETIKQIRTKRLNHPDL